jgi:cytochrome c peroxidase
MTIAALVLIFFLAPASHAANPDPDLETEIKALLAYSPFKRSVTSTPQMVELGRQLFFDPRLSKTNAMSCATCHQPAHHWTDGLPRARGASGMELARNTPSLFTAPYTRSFFWDGSTEKLEYAPLVAIQNPKEMDQDLQELMIRLERVPSYVDQFNAVYASSGITPARLGGALAAFIDSIAVTDPSPFDQFLKDRSGLGESARNGFLIFAGKGGCVSCHSGINFTDSMFHNIGIKKASPPDVGRYHFDPQPDNWGAFKTPSLRNVELTAPYMHDGSLKTLREVVDFYARGGDDKQYQDSEIHALTLTEAEKNDLVAFLKSLTTPQKPVTPPLLPPMVAPSPGAAQSAAAASKPASRAPEPDVDGLLVESLREASAQTDDLRRFFTRPSLWVADGLAGDSRPGLIDPEASREYCLHSPVSVAELPEKYRLRYYVCLAREKNDLDVCEGLGTASQTRTSAVTSCRKNFSSLSLAEKIISKNPGALDACMHHYGVSRSIANVEARRKMCAVWVQAGDVYESCVQFAAYQSDLEHLRKQYTDECLKTASLSSDVESLRGTQENCSQFSDDDVQKDICPDMRAYRKAWSRQDPAACGDRSICKVLMGDASACENDLAGQLAGYCEERLRTRAPSGTAARGARTDAVTAEIQDALRQTQGRSLSRMALEAVGRLHDVMLGRVGFEPRAALADVALLKEERLDASFLRTEALLLESHEKPSSLARRKDELDRLRADIRSARARWAKDFPPPPEPPKTGR